MSKYRQIAEDIFENTPDWHSTEDLIDAVEAAIEDAVEAQKRTCIEAIQEQKARLMEAYAACHCIEPFLSGAQFWIVGVLEGIINIIFDL